MELELWEKKQLCASLTQHTAEKIENVSAREYTVCGTAGTPFTCVTYDSSTRMHNTYPELKFAAADGEHRSLYNGTGNSLMKRNTIIDEEEFLWLHTLPVINKTLSKLNMHFFTSSISVSA